MAEKSYGGTWWSWTFELGYLADDGVFRDSPLAHTIPVWLHWQNTNFNEFRLHLRAILSLPILKLPWKKRRRAVILASENSIAKTQD
jgi:phosphoribosylglycinamide formyltransferase 2